MTDILTQRAVSTWSLHRTLGRFVADNSAVGGGPFMAQTQAVTQHSLLDLIPEIAAHGYNTLQICHFHLESRDPDYLLSVRAALASNGITLDALLIDDGDLTAGDIEPQLHWYGSWLTAAETLGANRARVCVGRGHPTPENLNASARHLVQFANQHPNVRIVIENWMEATPDAASVLQVLNATGEHIGLLIDLANWKAPDKYAEMVEIAPYAETCHAKCIFTEDGPDEADFRRTLSILKDAGFDGPLALIYDGPDPDEWGALDKEWDIILDVFGQN